MKRVKIKIILLYLSLICLCAVFLAEKYFDLYRDRRIKNSLFICADAFDAFQSGAGNALEQCARNQAFRDDVLAQPPEKTIRLNDDLSGKLIKHFTELEVTFSDETTSSNFSLAYSGTGGVWVCSPVAAADLTLHKQLFLRHRSGLEHSREGRSFLFLEEDSPVLFYGRLEKFNSVSLLLIGQTPVAHLKKCLLPSKQGEEKLDLIYLRKRNDIHYLDTLATTVTDKFGKPIVDNLHVVNSLKALLSGEENVFYRHLFERFLYVMNVPLHDMDRGGLLQICLSFDSGRIGVYSRIVNVAVLVLLLFSAILLINLAFTWKEFGMKMTRRFVMIFLAATILPIFFFRFAYLARSERTSELSGNVTEVNLRLGIMLGEYLERLETIAKEMNDELQNTSYKLQIKDYKEKNKREGEIDEFPSKIYLAYRVSTADGDILTTQTSAPRLPCSFPQALSPFNSVITSMYLRENRISLESYVRKVHAGRIVETTAGIPLNGDFIYDLRRHKAVDMAIIVGDNEYFNTSEDRDIPFALTAPKEREGIRNLESFVTYRISRRGLPYSISYSRLYGATSKEPSSGARPIAWLACALNRTGYLYFNKLEDNNVVAGVILLILIAFTAGWFITRDMIKPLSEMIRGANAVSAGNFNITMDLKTKDEFKDLVDSFNRMTHGLRERELLRGAFHMYVDPHLAGEIIRLGRIDAMAVGAKCEATVVFADVCNFTPFTEGRNPVEVVELLNTYFSLIVDVIIRYEGRLDKFIGDCAMAVFGDIVRHDDDVLRAVRAALDIREEVRKLNESRMMVGLQTLHFKIGINTGEMITGNIGSAVHANLTVIGDAVNLSSRLEGLAGPDEIFISEATFNKVETFAIVEGPADVFVRGKSAPQKAYKLIGLKTEG